MADRYRLIYQEDDVPMEHVFERGEVLIGRSPDCQVALKDFGVSRHHARLVVDESGVRILDLASKNGTQINDVLIVEARLKDGDKILLGKLPLSFKKSLEGKVFLDERKSFPQESGTIIRSLGEVRKLLSEPDENATGPVVTKQPATDIVEIEKSNRILKVLTQVARTLIAVGPVEDVLHQVMDIVFEQMPGADRGFLMLRERHSSKLVPMVVKYRGGEKGGEQGRITISKTIADRVLADKVSILTSDAQVDPRFGAGDSIRFHGIRSAMCAPLTAKDEVIGIIHVDSPMSANCFTLDDLDMLSALATYAAIGIDRASLNEKVLAEEKKKERLGRFLSPQVTNRILASSETVNAPLGAPEVKDVSVLFADIVGFTSMSESMSPAAVALMLNDYLSRMTEVIFKFEGTLDKYIGDSIMAVFGAPIDMRDHAARSIRAALEMRERLEEFNAERRDHPKIQVRIGINSGKCVAGEIGSINKKEYTVLGDTVNIASRIESSVAQPGMIVVGENTFRSAADEFEFAEMGSWALKGRQQQVSAFEVRGVRRPAAAARA